MPTGRKRHGFPDAVLSCILWCQSVCLLERALREAFAEGPRPATVRIFNALIENALLFLGKPGSPRLKWPANANAARAAARRVQPYNKARLCQVRSSEGIPHLSVGADMILRCHSCAFLINKQALMSSVFLW